MRKIIIFLCLFLFFTTPVSAANTFWSVQSIDTMKYSRDGARQHLSQQFIDSQITKISHTGATHVAIDTPYDNEFIPVLKQWVKSARTHGLHVWFRGNFSGWEGWFSYPKILTRQEHLIDTVAFIKNNPDLFENGDVFTACPECEDGGPGDPRFTGDVNGFRQFMIAEYQQTQQTFLSIGKRVKTNYDSMNGDVARLVMDKQTTQAMGGVVTIDHYVPTPEKLAHDIVEISENSGGEIVLGEFGTPIPDITGNQTEQQQAQWLSEAFSKIYRLPQLVGLNYWVSFGGSTAIWFDNGDRKLAEEVLAKYYKPNVLYLKVTNENNDPVLNANINYLGKTTSISSSNSVFIPYENESDLVGISAPGYQSIASSVLDFKNRQGKVTLNAAQGASKPMMSTFRHIFDSIYAYLGYISNLFRK